MKILLSVFACLPGAGSEGGVGWRWALELAQHHEVVALTDPSRRRAIEQALKEHPVPNLTIVYHRPFPFRGVPLNSWTANLLYSAWQYLLLPTARRLHRIHRFDLAIHLTYGVFRTPSLLGYLGIPFVFGPVGGAEDAPRRLRRSMPLGERFKEGLRSLAIFVARHNPILSMSLRRAGLVFARTEETRRALPAHVRPRCHILQEIGTLPREASTAAGMRLRNPGEPLRLLLVARLQAWKGIHFALRAMAEARKRGVPVTLTVAGEGPQGPWLKEMADRLGLGASVQWLGRIPQEELLAAYQTYHAFLFPSLHDSGGTAVLEAKAGGLGIICLDLGGPATMVTAASACVVPARDTDEEGLVQRLADVIQALEQDDPRRCDLARAAHQEALQQTWTHQVARFMDKVQGILQPHPLPAAPLPLLDQEPVP